MKIRVAYYIYVLVDPRNNKPFYVGSTSNPKRRMTEHNTRWSKIRGIRPIMKIKRKTLNQERAWELEFQLIVMMKKRYERLIINKGFMRGKRISK